MVLNQNEVQYGLSLLAKVASQREQKLKTYLRDNTERQSNYEADN